MGRTYQRSKIESLKIYPEIRRMFDLIVPDVVKGEVTIKAFFDNKVRPVLPDGHTITYSNFFLWAKKFMKTKRTHVEHRSLMDREMEKTKTQIEIRQDATFLMKQFLNGLQYIADDPRVLAQSGVKVTEIYKIIREEEDRQKALQLRERAENRADASFAFLVSVARANQVEEADIEFLEDGLRAELIELKQKNGVYMLPTPGFVEHDGIDTDQNQGQLLSAEPATETDFALAGEGNQAGA
jgi:hypothetical protein